MYAYTILLSKPDAKTPLGRPYVVGDNIKIDHREIRLEDVDWIHLGQERDW
jgi:hypothetical protein